ncbi:hypothetical protein N8772_02530 [Rickettsiales bacterium]|nr:hypothetical protein [Rickettsiales bacterium]
MPQFDITYFSSQIFWLAICFTIIYFLTKRMFMPKMSKIIDDRSDKIEQLRLDAEKLNQKLAKINEKIESVRNDSVLQYSQIIANAKLKSNKKRSDFIKKNQDQIVKLQDNSSLLLNNIMKDYDNNSNHAIDKLVKNISNNLISKKIN